MTENRISADGTTPADGSYPPVSPTGAPVIGQLITKAVAAVVGIAAVLVTVLPPNTIAFKVSAAIVSLGTFFGIVSPGVRKAAQ